MNLYFLSALVAGLLSLLGLSALAQQTPSGERLIFSHDESGDCRMKPADLRPLIDAYNPFFADHRWNDTTKVETATLGPGRKIRIVQKACLRHHSYLYLSLDRSIIPAEEASFFVVELFGMLNKLYFNQTDYYAFKNEFESTFLERYSQAGHNAGFNFPLVDRSFLCEVLYEKGKDATLQLEIVRLLLRENVKLPGIPAYMDDGHFQPPTFQPQNANGR